MSKQRLSGWRPAEESWEEAMLSWEERISDSPLSRTFGPRTGAHALPIWRLWGADRAETPEILREDQEPLAQT